MKFILSVVFALVFINSSIAKNDEKIIDVKSIRGEYAIVLHLSDVTGREAVQLAREDAKRKALEKVCGSKISIWDQIETSSAGDVFNSLSINQVDGEIVEFYVVEEGCNQSPVRPSETIFYCIANASVKRGVRPDPSFTMSVTGLKSVYYTNDLLQFEVLPHQNCYMNIFLLENESTGYLLYPNSYDKSRMFVANNRFKIADAPNYEFVMQKNPKLKKEINRLVFVFTKEQRNFDSQVTSRQEIEKWIASIPNDSKYIHFAIIEIRDN